MAAWRFAYLPKKLSAEIKKSFPSKKKGWGSLPVTAKIGATTWDSSIFPDSKSSSYLLPLKLKIRKKEGVMDGAKILVEVRLRV